MIRTLKRGTNYHIDCQMGDRRLRGALGTKDKSVASRLRSRIEMAMVEGSRSDNWVELRKTLPASTYSRFAAASGLPKEAYPSWAGLVSIFRTECEGRIKLGKMARSTMQRYDYVLDRFAEYLNINNQAGETPLSEITPWLVEDFKVWRRGQILAKANARGGNGLAVEVSVLHTVFEVAVERHMISRNPVAKGYATVKTEVQPFTGAELQRLRDACQTDKERLVYLLFRFTGMRISDIADLKWRDFHFLDHEIVKRTIKRGTTVYIPLHQDLWAELMRTKGDDTDQHVVMLKNKPPTTAYLRSFARLISQRAKVENAHPHRYRHTVCCDLLMKGLSPFEVAKIVGDTVATIEKHYLKFIPSMRTKAKGLIDDNTKGLEANV